MHCRRLFGLIALLVASSGLSTVLAESPSPEQQLSNDSRIIAESLSTQWTTVWERMSPAAKRGFDNLVSNVYLPHDFDESILAELDKEPTSRPFEDSAIDLKGRSQTFARFGLSSRPLESSKPLQYVKTKDGSYAMNCFACHGGNLFGTTYPGAPNTMYALESLTESVRKTKLKIGKPLAHMDVGSMFMPLGKTVGTSNAVMFGVALMNYRDAELNVYPNRAPADMTHHDMDTPPWWHFHKKHHIYIDGFAEKGHRGLMQFMLVRQNGPEQFRAWENDFRDVYAFLQELRPPKYPLNIDKDKAERGEKVFHANCASCHGTYGKDGEYPEIHVPIDDVKTDRVRFDALSPQHRQSYGVSWFANMGQQNTLEEVDGYVAPPLDGIWASAPYLHNGSVPTLWHLLHPESRPKVWRRTHIAPDTERIGFQVEELERVPNRLSAEERRRYFDTRGRGKSSSGHDYPATLSSEDRSDLLEYLKTL